MTIKCPTCDGVGSIYVVNQPRRVTCSNCKGKKVVHDDRPNESVKAQVQIVRLLFPR